ncbi:MAG: ABC transporter ATP-binding protein [Myxococcales bacterium]|nr:ABC transporter ATP-binding protein [Myxococcales bacterium]
MIGDPPTTPAATRVSDPILSLRGVTKVYEGGLTALSAIDLDIERGEIFALLGPNGAGKTTLIGVVCGIVRPTSGQILADGYDVARDYRKARQAIGLVPQELSTDAFESVWSSVKFSRGLFGKRPDPAYLEGVLKALSLWDKRDDKIMTLSGGMKRRVLIAKALSHEPHILFLDEPTAGVDVELRRDMWAMVHELRKRGVTIILTTHYIEEAEQMADRIGVIDKGKIVLVERKNTLMRKLGQKQLILHLSKPSKVLPKGLEDHTLELSQDGYRLVYTFDKHQEDTGIANLLARLSQLGIEYTDLQTQQSSLEDIFVSLVRAPT